MKSIVKNNVKDDDDVDKWFERMRQRQKIPTRQIIQKRDDQLAKKGFQINSSRRRQGNKTLNPPKTIEQLKKKGSKGNWGWSLNESGPNLSRIQSRNITERDRTKEGTSQPFMRYGFKLMWVK